MSRHSAYNSSLGNHSSDFMDFRGTADSMSSSPPLKSIKSPTSNTANTRIVDSKSLESQVDSTMAESRPSRGAKTKLTYA
ncbi:hypothetical protein [Helicobacter cinaedi]|uniref:hypothetical protein n=1 Tax=Helicobacter cinaedi TaxID=213 RepID=UPI000DC733AF|nr:hypothetical protein [Helicobacter cinaedi]BBB19727.1 alanyl-tRNA synthetase [Helicobacter cinaedi]